jgi:hypothetical protein
LSARSQVASKRSSSIGRKAPKPALLNHDLKAVELTGYFRDYAPDFVRIEHVEAPALSLATAGLNFVDDGAEASFVDISNRRHRAFLCEQVSRRAPHPTGGTGDQYRAAFYRTIKLPDRLHVCLP